jgi:hypothetical protein
VESSGCGIARSVGIVLFSAALTIVVLVMARRERRPAWLLPALVGAMLAGMSAGALSSVIGLINIVRGILVTGAGGLGAFGQGWWDANQTWRVGLYTSLIASLVLALKYFFLPRVQTSAEARWAPRSAPSFLFSVLPFLGAAISFVSFQSLNRALLSTGQSGMVQWGSTDVLVSNRAWLIGIAALTTILICILNIPLSLAFRKPGEPSPAVQRVAGALLGTVGFFLLIALTMLIAFIREVTALATGG